MVWCESLAEGRLPPRLDMSMLFAPTGPIQEVSLSSGWGDKFIAVADRFDRASEVAYGSVENGAAIKRSTMDDASFHIAGQLATWPDKERMADILRRAGLDVYVGPYSVRVEDCSHFVFQEYGGDRCEPSVDADAGSLGELTRDGTLVSDALARAGIRHRFELYNGRNEMVGYLHHDWPPGHDA
jgi:hypothetical protein